MSRKFIDRAGPELISLSLSLVIPPLGEVVVCGSRLLKDRGYGPDVALVLIKRYRPDRIPERPQEKSQPIRAAFAPPVLKRGAVHSSLDLDDDRQDHRPAAGAVVDDLSERFVQVLLEELYLGHVVGEEIGEDAVRLLA